MIPVLARLWWSCGKASQLWTHDELDTALASWLHKDLAHLGRPNVERIRLGNRIEVG
jgi:hypothetical protein